MDSNRDLDRIAYEALAKIRPALSNAIRDGLAAGVTAKEIEKRLCVSSNDDMAKCGLLAGI